MKQKNDSALYIGPSHAEGGIPVIVDPNKATERPVEVEGMEYKICQEAYNQPWRLNYHNKTNFEILEDMHQQFFCKFEQNKADGGDFIICKVVVQSPERHDRSGTVKEILDQLQSEGGCRLSNGQIAEKANRGGQLKYQRPILFGSITWKNDDDFYKQYKAGNVAIHDGRINFKKGAEFYQIDAEYYFEPGKLETGTADMFDISKMNIADVSNQEIARVIMDTAILLPGNTVAELIELKKAYPQTPDDVLLIDTTLLKTTLVDAAKILGYEGIRLWDKTMDSGSPSALFIWNFGNMEPIIIHNPSNYRYFEGKGSCKCKHEEGGPIEEEKKNTGYDARVTENLKQMDAPAEEWRATPIVGMQEVEANGKMRLMPIFDFPKNYSSSPTLYPVATGPFSRPNCELCGKEPIATVYWIQNDKKKWTMGVGSECVTHFGEGKSGKELQRQLKVDTALAFDAKLYELATWLKRYYNGTPYSHPLAYNSYRGYDWSQLWMPENTFGERKMPALDLFRWLLPFDYLSELDKAIKKGADPETASKNTERKLLSWYAREEKQKTKNIQSVYRYLVNQPENFFAQNQYKATEQEQGRWLAAAQQFKELAGEYFSGQLSDGGQVRHTAHHFYPMQSKKIEPINNYVRNNAGNFVPEQNLWMEGRDTRNYESEISIAQKFGKVIDKAVDPHGNAQIGNKVLYVYHVMENLAADIHDSPGNEQKVAQLTIEAFGLKPSSVAHKKEFGKQVRAFLLSYFEFGRGGEIKKTDKVNPTKAGAKAIKEKYGVEVIGKEKGINYSNYTDTSLIVCKPASPEYDEIGIGYLFNEFIGSSKVDTSKPMAIAFFGDRNRNAYEYSSISNSLPEICQTLKNWDIQEAEIFLIKRGKYLLFTAYPQSDQTNIGIDELWNKILLSSENQSLSTETADNGGKGEQSILNQETDLLGDEKYGWMKVYEPPMPISERNYEEDSKRNVSRMVIGFLIKKAVNEGKYQQAISEARMTAQDAKTIIESAGLPVPEEIIQQLQVASPADEEILLYHRSPKPLKNGKVFFDAFFGTKEFSEVYKEDFGEHLYVARMPREIKERLLDLNADTAEARDFMASVAHEVYPNDSEYYNDLLTGNKEAIFDFYDIWTDKNHIIPVLRKTKYLAVKFHDEYQLPTESVEKLVFIDENKNLQKELSLVSGKELFAMTVQEICSNIGRVQQKTYEQINPLNTDKEKIHREIAHLQKRDDHKRVLKIQEEEIEQKIKKLNAQLANAFHEQYDKAASFLRKWSIENKLLTRNETSEESDTWQNMVAEFWDAFTEPGARQSYWENTAEFVWRNILLDFSANKKLATGESIAEQTVFSKALNRLLPASVSQLVEYLMLRSLGNKLVFAGYQTDNEPLPAWVVSIKNKKGVLDQVEINTVFNLRAKVTVKDDVTTITLPHNIGPADYKKALLMFESIKNELIDYRIRLKQMFLKAQEQEQNLAKGNIVIFTGNYDFYFAFHHSAEVLNRELGFVLYHMELQKHEKNEFARATNDYVIFAKSKLGQLKALKKAKGINVKVADQTFGFETSQRLISLDSDEQRLEMKLLTFLNLLKP